MLINFMAVPAHVAFEKHPTHTDNREYYSPLYFSVVFVHAFLVLDLNFTPKVDESFNSGTMIEPW